jgi:hypothetical protein
MSYDEGSRVLAISHTEDHPTPGAKRKLFVFGEGVYVGDKLMPGKSWPCDEETYEIIAKVVTEHDDEPIEEHYFLGFYDAAVAAQPDVAPKRTREETISGLLAERERPLDDRVRDLWEKTSANPCIHLDSGDTVWGFQCWWGPLDRADRRFPEDVFERVVVPVPEVNERWQE